MRLKHQINCSIIDIKKRVVKGSVLQMPEAIQTINNIDQAGLNLLERAGYQVSPVVEEPVAIVLRSHKLSPDEVPDSVQVIGRAGSGTNNIDVQDATQRGIVVMNAAGANANAVAELVIPSAVAVARNLIDATGYTRGLAEDSDYEEIEKNKGRFAGTELRGRTLAVIGLGSIGMRVVQYGLGHGMKVKAYERFFNPDLEERLDGRVQVADSALAACDGAYVVTPHVLLTDETRGIIGADEIAAMDQSGIVLNYARLSIVDENALVPHLGKDKVRYLTDFPNAFIHGREGVIETPHFAASTSEAETDSSVMVAAQIDDFLRTGNIKNSVNFGDVDVPVIRGLARVVVLHRNQPGMAGHIANVFGSKGINIERSTTVSKKETGGASAIYNLETDSGEDLHQALEEISEMSEVLRVRELEAS